MREYIVLNKSNYFDIRMFYKRMVSIKIINRLADNLFIKRGDYIRVYNKIGRVVGIPFYGIKNIGAIGFSINVCRVNIFKKGNEDSYNIINVYHTNTKKITDPVTIAKFLISIIKKRGYKMSHKNDFKYDPDNDILFMNTIMVYNAGIWYFDEVKKHIIR